MPGFRYTSDPVHAALLKAAGITDAAAGMAIAGGFEVASSGTTSVVEIRAAAGSVFIKRYWYRTAGDVIRGIFRGTLFGRSKARREYENLIALEKLGFPVARPAALGECRGTLFLSGCFVATAGIADAVRADTWLAGLGTADAARRKKAVLAAAKLVSGLRAAGYSDGSMTLRNLLVLEQGNDLRIFKVDCVKGKFRLPAGTQAVEDIARLEASASPALPVRDRLRFLKAWAGNPCKPALRKIAREIARRSQRYSAAERARLKDRDALGDRTASQNLMPENSPAQPSLFRIKSDQ